MTYTKYMHGICLTYTIFKFCKLSKQQSMLGELEIHVRSMEFQDNYSIALKRHDLLSERIYKVYSRYKPCIYYAYTMRRSLARPHRCPSALGSLRPGLPSELLSFGHREAAHARLGPSKAPQSGVDLVNMAAPPRGRASTIGTAALKSVTILLSVAVLMWNSWGCISVQKAWNEWNSAEEVLNTPDAESENRWGLVYPVNSFRFHDSSSPQAKLLKEAEENQVERNVLVWTVVAARRSTHGTQSTVPNEIWSLQHLGVTVNHGGNDVLPVHPKNHWCSSSLGQDVKTSKRLEETVCGTSDVQRPWPACRISMFNLGILLVYAQTYMWYT
jgi:hypothetical protein